MSVHRIIIAGMMRGSRMSDTDATAQQHRHANSAARHILQLGNLINDLTDGIENEIGEHEIDYGSRFGHCGAAREPDKAALTDWRIAQSHRAVQVVEPDGGSEVPAAFTYPFTKHEDSRVRCHL